MERSNKLNDLVSVVVPVFNVEKYVDRCLESIVNQSYKNIEILLIDDGSTDESGRICDLWAMKDCRICVYHKENEGLGSARNMGIELAKGEYIAFIDSDDWWELDLVEKMITIGESKKADLIFMDFYWEEKQESGIYKHRIYCQMCCFEGVSNAAQHRELVFSNDARTWSKFYRTRLFKENNVRFPSHPFEDFPVNPILVILADRLCYANEPLYHYDYRRSGNITSLQKNYRFFKEGLNELKGELITRGYWEEYKHEYTDYAIALCRNMINSKNMSKYDEKFLLSYLKENYPDQMKAYSKKFGYIGSFAGFQILIKNVFYSQIYAICIENIPESGNREFDFVSVDISKLQMCDCIVVDLFETYDAVERIKKIEKAIEDIKKEMPIALFELFYATRSGTIAGSTVPYEEIDAIMAKNEELELLYKNFKLGNRTIKHIRFDDQNMYTYKYTNYGCKPQYFNGRFYTSAFHKFQNEFLNQI